MTNKREACLRLLDTRFGSDLENSVDGVQIEKA